MRLYKIPSATVITILENKKYITFKLLNNLILNEGDLQSIEDSFMDLANYGVIGLMVQRGKWPTT